MIYHYLCKSEANKYYVVLEREGADAFSEGTVFAKEESDEEAEENDSLTRSRVYGGKGHANFQVLMRISSMGVSRNVRGLTALLHLRIVHLHCQREFKCILSLLHSR